jgi:hypothetical protein
MQTYQADMQRRIDEVRLTSQEITRLGQYRQPVKIAALSEDWCIDCLMTLPIMAQITAAAPNLELRIFSRSKWPQLKEFNNGRGIMSIPTYSFLTPDFQEFGILVERPQIVHQMLGDWKAAHPEIEAIRRSATLSSEDKSTRLAQIRLQMQAEMEGWYRDTCQSALVDEVVAILNI